MEVLGLQVARLNPCLNRHRYMMVYSLEPFPQVTEMSHQTETNLGKGPCAL